MNTNRQHTPPHQQHLTVEQIQKQREYLKQQQKLRLMAASSTQKTVTADTLIENLLGKKDTFKPAMAAAVPSAFQTGSSSGVTSVPGRLNYDSRQAANPQTAVEWLSTNSLNFPVIYRRVWGLVGQPDGMVDTKKIFPLLLTSGLHTDVLGYIWGLANQHVAGQLTESELYVLLALVALAQKGYSFNSANVLSLVPQPPLPNLNLGVEPQLTTMIQHEDLILQAQPAATSIVMQHKAQTTFMPTIAAQLQSAAPPVSQSFASETIISPLENDFDDFADFQSASTNCPLSSSKSELVEPKNASGSVHHDSITEHFKIFEPSQESFTSLPITPTVTPSLSRSAVLPEPVFIQKFPTVTVVGSGGRSVGSRLANHSLGASKTIKSRFHKHHHHRRNTPPHSETVEDDFSDFQQASGEELFSKCLTVPKPLTAHTFILKESAIRIENPERVESSLSSSLVVSKPDLFGETGIKTSVVDDNCQASEPVSGILTENVRGSELMGTEDRYGALRALSFFSETPAETSDDFGDFLSTQLPTADDSFAEIAGRVNEPAVADAVMWGSTNLESLPEPVEFQVDDWSTISSATTGTGDFSILSQPEVNTRETIQPIDTSGSGYSLLDNVTNQIGLVDLNLNLDIETMSLHSDTVHSLAVQDDIQCMSFNLMDIPIAASNKREVKPLNIINFIENKTEDDDFGEFVGPSSFLEGNQGISVQANENTVSRQEEKYVDDQCIAGLWLDETKNEHPWPEEESKYDRTKIFKGGAADNHLVSNLWLEENKGLDTHSVRSLELPGLEQAWDAVGEWRKCLQSCVTILQCAVNMFEAILEPTVLLEVLNSTQGQDYLKDVVEVWALCERLAMSYRQSGADPKIDALLNSAEAAWLLLKPHFCQAEISLEPETATDGQERCGVCLVGGAVIEFESHSYHASCANLWLNTVDNVLPALHQP